MTTGTKHSMYQEVRDRLSAEPKTWLVTGVAGFIGSSLLESLLHLGQRVVGLDNFATGHRRNLEDVRRAVGQATWRCFRFVEGDITDPETCRAVCIDVDLVLHQAALASVPRSIQDPLATHQANITGFLNMLVAARDRRVARFVYATSSSVYGSHAALPKIENRIGAPLSPYAATKYVNELYAKVFAGLYGVRCVGLRYFNVFGPRQDPAGPYAAVIPRWVGLLLRRHPCPIYGDGGNSRDFCYVADVVQANLLAAVTQKAAAVNQVYNIAFGRRITLNELYATIRDKLAPIHPGLTQLQPLYLPVRLGDIRHSWASIEKAVKLLEYAPSHSVEQGLDLTLPWYLRHAPFVSARPNITPADPQVRPGYTGEPSPVPRPV